MEEEITIVRKKPLRQKISEFFVNPKKRLVFIIISGVILIAAVGTGLYLTTRSTAQTTNKKSDDNINKTSYETKYYSSLDGTEVADQAIADKHPLAVIVENHVDARPQAGLDKASVVYEAIAEGGITRFLSIFSSKEADKVGPIRSARTYFVNWAEGYNAYLAHVGGNYDALEQILADGVLDLDQFKYSSSYWRDSSLKRSTEHTMFSSTIKLRDQASKLGYITNNTFRQYKFSKPDKNPQTTTDDSDGTDTTSKSSTDASTTATSIDVKFSSASYDVNFAYDTNSNSYKRVVSGRTQLDSESKAEIAPTNLIVMSVKRSPTVTKINEQGWNMDTIGEGAAKIFINGKVIDGKWSKNSKKDREVFYDSDNQEITFERGQFWICVIPPDSKVTYK